MEEQKPRITTLVIPHTDTHVLLGMKKRGFGEGRWNGFGGKVDPGETIEEAARREFLEESGCQAREFTPAGLLQFSFEDVSERPINVHLFRARDLVGEPKESEEMSPQWFSFGTIPFEAMWPDDRYWLPGFLVEKKDVNGAFHFQDFNTILHFKLEVI